MKKILLLIGIIIAFSGCTRNIDIILPPSINPSDVITLSKYITLDKGAIKRIGELPSPQNLFQISNLNTSIISSNGSTASIVLKVDPSIAGNITGYYINIQGSDIYYSVPLNSISSNGLVTIPIGLPTVLEAGKFCVNVMTYNSQNQTSNVVSQCVDIVRLGSGALQINLAWDTNYTDIDLHVIDPSGYEIYFAADYSYSTGGQLDRDDVDGFGPENIYWNDKAPDGDYLVYIHYYDGGQRTNNYITINGPRNSKSFTKTLNSVDDYEFITRVRKAGDRITFLSNENLRMTEKLNKKNYPSKK